ncbi:hypothetical protein [Sphingobacterium kitahiroshimense]|uniref:Uncharacterized protein n=1 Tax=Sphingobacterium kitahiroshimense TaxID=470446 RepID=A0ABV0BY60_9SPHI
MENRTKFETFDQLVFLTELYQNEDSFNKTASLLINALNDWPNAHSLKISEFIQEFDSHIFKLGNDEHINIMMKRNLKRD